MALSHISVEAPLRVYDVADPSRYGTIIKVGAEVSEVRFDDGPERNIPNSHLRPVESVDEELTRSTHPEEAVLDHGREAWNRLRTNHTWDDWKAVGKACAIGQVTAMHDGHVNKPKGRSFNAAISAWNKKYGFQDLDKGVRSRLLDVMKHLAEIEIELAKLPLTKRQQLNHPNAVWRFWKKLTKPSSSAPSVSAVQKLKDSIVLLQEDNDRMKREIDQGGGDLWDAKDKPQDIAKVIFNKVGKSKAEKVALAILKLVKPEGPSRPRVDDGV
jgi:hypothetical protein